MKAIKLGTSPNGAAVRFLGRQPIIDKDHNLFGHELLFRSGLENAYSGDPEAATRDVIDHYLLLTSTSASDISFVNCTREALVSGIVTLLPSASTVLEILETVEPDPELLDVCVELKKNGYRFALDDFMPDGLHHPFLPIADFIKIDFLASDVNARGKTYALAASYRVRFIAEKVETAAEVKAARDEGCDLFQGYFFSKPTVLQTKVVPQNYLTHLQLLAALAEPPADLSEIERLVMSDASVCYRLLRLVNSALYGLPTHIASIRGALIMVGEKEFRKMVTIALVSAAKAGQSEYATKMALQRARFCELLAPSINESPSKLYLLGMLSLLDVILDIPMAQLLETMPVDSEMKAALLGEHNGLSLSLELVRCHETADWACFEDIRKALRLDEPKTSMIYVDAVHWAEKILKAAT